MVTEEIVQTIGPMLKGIRCGLVNLFLQHTSAALTINENCDPDVRQDMSMVLDTLVPLGKLPYTHTDEGLDDMPAHVVSSMLGVSLTIPITNGQMALGTWQGIWLAEQREHGGKNRCILLSNEPFFITDRVSLCYL